MTEHTGLSPDPHVERSVRRWYFGLHDSPLEGDGFELPVPVRQAKLTRSCRRKTGPGKVVARRREASVAQSSATADAKRTQRSDGVWD